MLAVTGYRNKNPVFGTVLDVTGGILLGGGGRAVVFLLDINHLLFTFVIFVSFEDIHTIYGIQLPFALKFNLIYRGYNDYYCI